ncbi:hypothetical protein KI387_001660 [Taxus chinensis]|uniref:CBM20 domain-containing protein n=1 Tax=Taxus chinensis TaxID=29808 RepID=A0AA38GXG6_TAXCH|nr:hypothetical protein KI387_001660 [Taxus chinensis]
MGAGGAKAWEKSPSGGGGEGDGEMQLYVSLNMEWRGGDRERDKDEPILIPHVYGSLPLVGSWDPSKALAMERESTSMWEISFVVPPNHETLDFKFLLKPKHSGSPCIVEEGLNRLLTGGALHGDAGSALFRLPENNEVLEYHVYIRADRVSPFDLAASWRAFQKNLQPSSVRGIPDVSINSVPVTGLENSVATSLELDLEHYEVPSPSANYNSVQQYAANKSENPRSLHHERSFSNPVVSLDSTHISSKLHFENCSDNSSCIKDTGLPVPYSRNVYLSQEVAEYKSVGTDSSAHGHDSHRGLLVDRGVGNSPKTLQSRSTSGFFSTELMLDTESENAMPEAAGAVAAAAVADRMLGPKEHRQMAIVLTADFFCADNQEGVDARNEVAALAMEDMLGWMQEGGQVGIFDATNSTRERRNMLLQMAEGKCKIIFLETICNDQAIIERNIRLKIYQSPDYANQPDFEAGMEDFKSRLVNYEKVYEPVEEGSYIKMIDMVSGQGGQIQVSGKYVI